MNFWEDVQTKNNRFETKDIIKDLHIKVPKEQNVTNRSCQGWFMELEKHVQTKTNLIKTKYMVKGLHIKIVK